MKAADLFPLALIALGVLWLLQGESLLSPPSPIKSPGFVVLIVEETANRSQLPQGQHDTIVGSAVGMPREYVTTKGGQWRVLDASPKSAELEVPAIREAFALPRTSLPWIVASNGRTGFSKPLPATTAEVLADLKQLGDSP